MTKDVFVKVSALMVEGPNGWLASVSVSDDSVGLLSTFERDFDAVAEDGDVHVDFDDWRAATKVAARAYCEGALAVLSVEESPRFHVEPEIEVRTYAEVLSSRAARDRGCGWCPERNVWPALPSVVQVRYAIQRRDEPVEIATESLCLVCAFELRAEVAAGGFDHR